MTKWEQYLTKALAELLDIETRDFGAMSFDELGFDSFTGLRLVGKLEDLTGVNIELEWIFDYPTLPRLALFLEEHFGSPEEAFTSQKEC